MNPAFFILHKDLPREGPGLPEDVIWAFSEAGGSPPKNLCDVGCGPGADIEALLSLSSETRVLGIDKYSGFVDQAQERYKENARVSIRAESMADIARFPEAPFDAIWCAGALYFLGLEEGLATMKAALRPSGILAFTEPSFFTDDPSEKARAFWEGYETRGAAEILAAIRDAGLETIAQRPLSDDAWEAYFQPQASRIAKLRPIADADLASVLDEAEDEAAKWRACKRETGYLLSVARKP